MLKKNCPYKTPKMDIINKLSDENLVIRYKKNQDADYFGEIYRRFYPKVYHYCLGKVKQKEDAYDITEDTFLRVAQKIQDLRNATYFVAWLFKIAHNLCMDLLKSRKPFQQDFNFLYLTDEADSEDLERLIQREYELNRLEIILESIDEETKSLLIDKYVNGLSLEDLERERNLSKSAIKMRLMRGKERIKKNILNN